MTVKDEMSVEEPHQSTIEYLPHQALPPSPSPVKDKGRNRGRLLSGIIIINVLILGCALISGSAFKDVAVGSIDGQIFLIFLLILTTIWMVYYTVYTSKADHAVLYKDGHAGPVWLRSGLVLFGLLALIMDVFKIANYAGYMHCDSGVKIAFPAVQFVFIAVQTSFLWLHAKDCVQLQKTLTCCGLMLILCTNLMLWVAAITEESLHQTHFPGNTNSTHSTHSTHSTDDTHGTNSTHSTHSTNYTHSTHSTNYTHTTHSIHTTPSTHDTHSIHSTQGTHHARAAHGDSSCQCSHSSCAVFEVAYYYLYPFYIEYCLFATALAYVMWRNVGRLVDEHNHHHLRFSVKDVLLGPALGMGILVSGLATFVIYEIDVEKHDKELREKALLIHYVMNIVAVALMSLATVAGCAIYKLDKRDHVSDKNPTRNLDVGLLVGTSIGQLTINYFTIVAVVETGATGHLQALNLVCSLLTIVQLCLQNAFIIEGLHREPFHDPPPASVFSNSYVHGANRDMQSLPGMKTMSSPDLTIPTDSIHTPSSAPRHKITWKRKALKEISAFLLLCNIILWIMPSFGARPQFDDPIGGEFYKINMWAAVVNIGLPFAIFYRMHSVASLCEVFLTS